MMFRNGYKLHVYGANSARRFRVKRYAITYFDERWQSHKMLETDDRSEARVFMDAHGIDYKRRILGITNYSEYVRDSLKDEDVFCSMRELWIPETGA